MTDGVRTCPACGSETPEGARYCPACGRALGEDLAPPAYTESAPRLFGVVAPASLFVLGCVLLVGALVTGIAGSLVGTVLLLAAAVAVFLLFQGAAERDPSGRLARAAVTTSDRFEGWARLTGTSTRAWGRAGRDVVRLRGQLRVLRRERAKALYALGSAVHADDVPAAATVRQRLRELDRAIAEREEAREESLARARGRIDEDRLPSRPTEILVPGSGDEPPDAAGKPAGADP